ncbi:MAG TPA: hypothetical protein PKD83_10090 [Ignavibacteria bacterium]|nr:hypothetical protein [Ignavibacteria bacterium]
MHKVKYFFATIFILLTVDTYGQVIPSLEFSTGISFPSGETGGDLISTNDSGVSGISQNFIKDNYGNSSGVTIAGSLKIPFVSDETFSGLITGGYSYFNAFRKIFKGVGVINNTEVPVSIDSRFSVSTFGLGLEIKPFPGSRFRPFLNSSFTINMISLSLEQNGIYYAFFSDSFRSGVLANGGVSYRLNNEYSITLGGNYTLANLLFKSSSDDFNDRAQFGRENIPINDDEGVFYSNLNDPDEIAVPVNGVKKNLNWWSINIGLNIILGKSGKK